MSAFRILFDTLPAPGTCCLVPPEQVHHLVRVRRVAVGDIVQCLDRAGAVCAAVVEKIGKSEVVLHLAMGEEGVQVQGVGNALRFPGCREYASLPRVQGSGCAAFASLPRVQDETARKDQDSGTIPASISNQQSPISNSASSSIILFSALLPESRFDWVLQKCTEIGVAACVPMAAARCVARIEANMMARKMVRWQKICDEAARQCGGAPMRVQEPVPFREALGAEAAVRIIADRGGKQLPDVPAEASPMAVLVGPEGGFAPEEIDAACAAGWQRVSFHQNILRAETAAVVCCALMQFCQHIHRRAKL